MRPETNLRPVKMNRKPIDMPGVQSLIAGAIERLDTTTNEDPSYAAQDQPLTAHLAPSTSTHHQATAVSTRRCAQMVAIVDTMSDAWSSRVPVEASTTSLIEITPCSLPLASTTGTRRT